MKKKRKVCAPARKPRPRHGAPEPRPVLGGNELWRDALRGYEAREPWYDDPATDRQLEALERRGWQPPYGTTKGEAHRLLSLPTPRQREVLERRGLWEDGITFDEAREALDALGRREGWGAR